MAMVGSRVKTERVWLSDDMQFPGKTYSFTQ